MEALPKNRKITSWKAVGELMKNKHLFLSDKFNKFRDPFPSMIAEGKKFDLNRNAQ